MGRSRNKLERVAPKAAPKAAPHATPWSGRWATLLGLCLALGACSRSEQPPPPVSDQAAVQTSQAQASATLARVRARRRLKCGVTDDKPGFSQRNLTGQWRGFDVDMCRAVAAAVLGDSRAVSFTPVNNRTRFAALQSGAVDLLSGGASWTFSHDEALGLSFVSVSYYDGQGFLVRAKGRLRTIGDLDGTRICVLGGASAQQALADASKARGAGYQVEPQDTMAQAVEAYRRRECDALSDDISVLAGIRAQLGSGAHVILPGSIADDPLGLMVREDDERWADIVRWTFNALVLGEDLQAGMQTAEQLRRDSSNPAIRRLLGVEGEFGQRLGLSPDWSYRALRQVGDYGEIYNRNLAGLGMERGRNALWDAAEPGQLYAPQMR